MPRILRRLADLMGLRDWTVEYEDEPLPDDGRLATCSVAYGRRCVVIAVSERFWMEDEREQRHALAHELVHVHVNSIAARVKSDVEGELGAPAFRIFWSGFTRDFESAVDSLANVIAPSLPALTSLAYPVAPHADDLDTAAGG